MPLLTRKCNEGVKECNEGVKDRERTPGVATEPT